MTAADARIPPLPAGTLCRKGAIAVRVYARIRVGEVWDGTYDCYLTGERPSPASHTTATREQLDAIGGVQ